MENVSGWSSSTTHFRNYPFKWWDEDTNNYLDVHMLHDSVYKRSTMWTRDDYEFPPWLDVDWRPRKTLTREEKAAYETSAKTKAIQKKREYLNMLWKSHNIMDEADKLVHANFRTISRNVPASLSLRTKGPATMKSKPSIRAVEARRADQVREDQVREGLIKARAPKTIPTGDPIRDPPNGLEDLRWAILAQMKPKSHVLVALLVIVGVKYLMQMLQILMVAFEMWPWYSEPL